MGGIKEGYVVLMVEDIFVLLRDFGLIFLLVILTLLREFGLIFLLVILILLRYFSLIFDRIGHKIMCFDQNLFFQQKKYL